MARADELFLYIGPLHSTNAASEMASTLTKRLLQIVIENSRLRQYARRLEARIEFLEKHCDCPPTLRCIHARRSAAVIFREGQCTGGMPGP